MNRDLRATCARSTGSCRFPAEDASALARPACARWCNRARRGSLSTPPRDEGCESRARSRSRSAKSCGRWGKTIAPSVTGGDFGAVVVIYRGSNELHLYNGEAHPGARSPVATGQAIYPTPTAAWHVVDKQRDPWWRPPDSPWAKGAEADPTRSGQPARHSLDGPRRCRRRHARHARRRLDRLLRLARVHPDADSRRGVAVRSHVRIGTPVFIVTA